MTGYDLTPQAKKALQQRIIDHADQQAEERRQQSLRDARNAETRKAYLAGLEAQKAEKAKLADIALDQELEPQKQILKRSWLANHPGKSSTDFEQHSWPLLRENLIVERDELARRAAHAEGRASRRYAL